MNETPENQIEASKDPEKYSSFPEDEYDSKFHYTNKWTKKLLSWGVEERGTLTRTIRVLLPAERTE